MATTFATLRTDDVGTSIEALLNMFRVTDHVHVENTSFVQSINDVFWRYPNSRDEELSTAVDDDADQLVSFALGVVVAKATDVRLLSHHGYAPRGRQSHFVFRALPPT